MKQQGIRLATSLAALALCIAMPVRAAAPMMAQQVLDCIRANVPQTLQVKEFELTSVDRIGGTRTLRGRLYAMREDNLLRAMIKMLAPADLARSSYLIREGKDNDEIYVYLPALDRVRRITGASAGGPLFGTDISYADVKQIESAFAGGVSKLEKDATLQDRPAWVLATTPKASQESRYSLIRGWIDQKTCMALKVDFYEGGAVRKELTGKVADLAEDHGHWYLKNTQMADLKDGTRTTLKITGVSSGNKLSSAYFNVHTFSTAD